MRDGERVGPWRFERRALLKVATAGGLLAVLQAGGGVRPLASDVAPGWGR